jgi:hypothetical protein
MASPKQKFGIQLLQYAVFLFTLRSLSHSLRWLTGFLDMRSASEFSRRCRVATAICALSRHADTAADPSDAERIRQMRREKEEQERQTQEIRSRQAALHRRLAHLVRLAPDPPSLGKAFRLQPTLLSLSLLLIGTFLARFVSSSTGSIVHFKGLISSSSWLPDPTVCFVAFHHTSRPLCSRMTHVNRLFSVFAGGEGKEHDSDTHTKPALLTRFSFMVTNFDVKF